MHSLREKDMIKTVKEYLDELKRELSGSDPALIQDAVSDAEEHLTNALAGEMDASPGQAAEEALAPIIEKYGSPSEIASAYREVESRLGPSLAVPRRQGPRSFLAKYFGILGEARAWGAFFYMLLSAVTGIVYGAWIFTAASVSALTLILIIGIPVTGLFLLSVRGMGLIEGRIVEALLGVRMPRKPIFVDRGLKWTAKLKLLYTDRQTWKTLLYLFLQMPLGLIYFFLFLILFTGSLTGIVGTILRIILHLPFVEARGGGDAVSAWWLPLIFIGGLLLLAGTMHMAKWVGKVHGRYAKAMLVRN